LEQCLITKIAAAGKVSGASCFGIMLVRGMIEECGKTWVGEEEA